MSAPSFSSFPSFGSFPQSNSGPSEAREGKEGKDPSRSTHSTKKRRQSRERAHKHKKRKATDDDCDFLLDERREDLTIYYVDSKGNRNAHYGGSDPIPKYHPVAYNQILGVRSGWIANHRNSGDIEFIPGGRRKILSLTDSKAKRLLLQTPRPISALPRSSKREKDENDDFIRLSGKLRKQDMQTYLSTNPDEPKSDSEGSSLGSASESELSDDDDSTMHLSSRQATFKSLEEQLRHDPSSIHTWLSLLSQSTSVVSLDSKNAVKTRAEITVSILARAISAYPSNKTCARLRLKYLKAGEEIWDERKCITEWEGALGLNSVEIWIAWFDWKISKAKDGIDGIIDDAKRALIALGPHNEMGQLRVQWRVAVALKQAGYVERAMAIFQSQAELAFEIPQSLYGLPLSTQLESLENFWDSEFPRIGEKNAQGWAAWEKAGRPEYVSHSTISCQVQSSTVSDPYQRWAAEEVNADCSVIPARSMDNTDDPYSTILFSDIRDLLVSLQSIKTKSTFRLIWLSFLGLHIPGFWATLSESPSENLDDRWCHTHLITPSYLQSIFPRDVMTRRTPTESHSGVLVGSEKHYSDSFGPVKNWGYSVFDSYDRLVNRNQTLWTKRDISGVHEEFVRNVFQQCRIGDKDAEWDSLAVALEAGINSKSAWKLSRSLLSSDQDTLSRWDIHAALERVRGRIEDARKIFRTVLTSSPAPPSDPEASLLWWSWAEMEWLADQAEAAQDVILRAAGVDGTSGVSILRAKRVLEEHIRTTSTTWREQEAWIKIRALLEILTTSPASALSFFDDSKAAFNPGSIPHETLTMISMAFLYHYGVTLRNPIPPANLRERVENALQTYPSNSFLLGLFLESQRGQGIWGEIHQQLGEIIVDGELQEKDVMRRVIEVWIESGWEHGRWLSDKERVRTGLSNAIQHERTRASPILWRIFIEFEILTNELDRAKQLLFQAVQTCPLMKEFYLLAFGPLRTVFTPRELTAWAETMAERGLRIRKELDEVVEPAHEKDVESQGGEDFGEADIEYNAEELRRLRPY